MVGLGLCVTAEGRTIYVDDDGPADFNNIQAAIDDANDGDIVVVADGIYAPPGDTEGYISFKGKAITLRSENGPHNCIIDGNEHWLGIFVFESEEGVDSVLEGFTIKDGDNWIGGGAITCSGASPTIKNCVITENYGCEMYEVAGGIALLDSDATILNCIISNNDGIYFGAGAIYCGGDSGLNQPSIINCTICGNEISHPSYRYASGIYSDNCNPIIKNCIIWANSPSDSQIVGTFGSVIFSDIQEAYPGQGNIDADPCFADADANDFHLKSQAGRWDANEGRWMKDDVTSPCIDAGDMSSPIGYEPFPNSGIINMGAYGSTAEASKSYFGEPICETIVAGDINGDCKVDFLDFALLALHWLEDNHPAVVTTAYVFQADPNTLATSGGIHGQGHGSYCVEGRFRLTVNLGTGIAFFNHVDATISDEIYFFDYDGDYITDNLDVLFKMTELISTYVSDTKIDFVFVRNIPSFPCADTHLTVTFLDDDTVRLDGDWCEPVCDGFCYHLYAVAVPEQ